MKLEVLNPETITLKDFINDVDNLYYLVKNPTIMASDAPYKMLPARETGANSMPSKTYLVVRITDEEMIFDESEENPVIPEDIWNEEASKPNPGREACTYSLNSHDPTESIFVEFRPYSGEIRVNFTDKGNAELYFNYFREQFYSYTSGVSVITVSNIYSDLKLVNWDPKDCDDWGWYTMDAGKCHYITPVRKTNNSKMFGFTLKHPTKLYESKKREEAAS